MIKCVFLKMERDQTLPENKLLPLFHVEPALLEKTATLKAVKEISGSQREADQRLDYERRHRLTLLKFVPRESARPALSHRIIHRCGSTANLPFNIKTFILHGSTDNIQRHVGEVSRIVDSQTEAVEFFKLVQ